MPRHVSQQAATTAEIVLGSFIQGNGILAPAVSGAGTGRLYYDLATNRWLFSANGGAYALPVAAPPQRIQCPITPAQDINAVGGLTLTFGAASFLDAARFTFGGAGTSPITIVAAGQYKVSWLIPWTAVGGGGNPREPMVSVFLNGVEIPQTRAAGDASGNDTEGNALACPAYEFTSPAAGVITLRAVQLGVGGQGLTHNGFMRIEAA